MNVKFAARVDIGPKETNDDRVLADGKILNMELHEGTVATPSAFVVCDGCGGYAGGWIAAETALGVLAAEEATKLLSEEYLAEVLARCEDAIVKKKEEMPQYSAMCTTVAGCVFGEDSTVFFHSGDSRVYRCDRWGLAKMTRDHSLVQEMVDMGQLTPDEAREHPKRNIIRRCLGVGAPPPDIYVAGVPLAAGEKYLMCSDGLWEVLEEEDIINILSMDIQAASMVDALVELALERGAHDNISACVCMTEGDSEEEGTKPFVLD
ncbi:MAG: serine/threonine-protein phosphatase [Clostridia bacterium]|nr:serine/threonine-protein phosphatase [Clostridia bacterium]